MPKKDTPLQELLVFGHDDKVIVLREVPDLEIIIMIHPQMHNMS